MNLQSSQSSLAVASSLLFASEFLARTSRTPTNSACSACLNAFTISWGSDSWVADKPCKIYLWKLLFFWHCNSFKIHHYEKTKHHWSCLEYWMSDPTLVPSPSSLLPLLCLLAALKLVPEKTTVKCWNGVRMIRNMKMSKLWVIVGEF